jgi:hypothetical protein
LGDHLLVVLVFFQCEVCDAYMIDLIVLLFDLFFLRLRTLEASSSQRDSFSPLFRILYLLLFICGIRRYSSSSLSSELTSFPLAYPRRIFYRRHHSTP